MEVCKREPRLCPKINSDTPVGKILTLCDLTERLHEVFKDDVVDIDHVQNLMAAYRSNPQEWRKYAKFDRYRYTRNLVDEGNGKFNLMVLCWGEGHGSAIHDHANAHCFMKILQGEMCETQYKWPRKPEELESCENHQELEESGRRVYRVDDVAYINDSIGLHRVENPSTINPAVSLHLYSPPFSSCSIYNKQTGQSTRCKVTFWSKFGERRNREIQDSRIPEDN